MKIFYKLSPPRAVSPRLTLIERCAVVQWVEGATPGKEVVGSIPAGWVDVSIMGPAETEVVVSTLCFGVTARKIARRRRPVCVIA